jgi:adenosylcobinamide-GDP ribazoletransferase
LGLLAALQFLTLLAVKRSFTSEQMGRSTAYFPVIGLIIGLILVGCNYVFSLLLPSAVVNIFLIILMALLSGGLHLDGLADTLDGIAGHRTPEQRLEIMRDSRIGGFGALGLALFLIAEYVTLNSLPKDWIPHTLVLSAVLSRWAMVTAIFVYPYARPQGLGRAFKDAVNWQQLALATLIAVVLAALLFKVAGMVILAAVWVVLSLVATYLKRQLKGLTGDTYGAINELAAISVMLMVNMLAFKHWLWI